MRNTDNKKTKVTKSTVQKGGVCPQCKESVCPLYLDSMNSKSKRETYHVDVTLMNVDTEEMTMSVDLTPEMRKKVIEWYHKVLSTKYFSEHICDIQIKDSKKFPGYFEISYVPIKHISHFEVTEPVDEINIKCKGETYKVLPNYDSM
jgi:hypothetical protein